MSEDESDMREALRVPVRPDWVPTSRREGERWTRPGQSLVDICAVCSIECRIKSHVVHSASLRERFHNSCRSRTLRIDGICTFPSSHRRCISSAEDKQMESWWQSSTWARSIFTYLSMYFILYIDAVNGYAGINKRHIFINEFYSLLFRNTWVCGVVLTQYTNVRIFICLHYTSFHRNAQVGGIRRSPHVY